MNINNKNIADKTKQEIKWSFGLQIFYKIFFIFSSIILARLLIPDDYGLAMMAFTIDMLVWLLMAMGVNTAVIHFQDEVEKRLNAAFLLLLLSAIFFTGLQFTCAPWLAAFYKAPLLENIVKISAIGLFINSFGIIHKTILIKNIDFKKIETFETLISLLKISLSLFLAFSGFGVWSFIYPKVIGSVINVICLQHLTKWRPSLNISFKHVIEMINYGKYVVFSNMIDYLINNSSYIIIGSLIGSFALGLYSFAYEKSMMVFRNITYPLMTVFLPTYSKFRNDENLLKNAFIKTLQLISLFVFPYVFLQITLGQEYIIGIFGKKWESSVLIFQIILIYSMFRSISQCGNPILKVIGKSNIAFKWNLLYTPVFVLSAYFTAKYFDIYTVTLICMLIGLMGSLFFIMIVIQILNWNVKEVFKSLVPVFFSSFFTGIYIALFKPIMLQFCTDKLTVLITCAILGLTIYFINIYCFFRDFYILITKNLCKIIKKKPFIQTS